MNNKNIKFDIEYADLNIKSTNLSEKEKKKIIDKSADDVFGQPTVQDTLRELSKI